MRRQVLKNLIEWKNQGARKPLILLGARQVGKTYLLEHFGRQHYAQVITYNFELDPKLHTLFSESLEPKYLLQALSLYSGIPINENETLLIFDEVQECPRALTSLKYFCEQKPHLHLACAGSLLGLSLSAEGSFPVGKVTFIQLYPLTFREFLIASEETSLVQYLDECSVETRLPEILHSKLLLLLRTFLITGGMPEAVNTFLEGDSLYKKTREIQQAIITGYRKDFTKHSGKAASIAISALWESIPEQLSKEQKRFYLSKVPLKETQRLKTALQWLIDAGLALQCAQIKSVQFPFAAYAQTTLSKLYLHDVGLLTALLQVPPSILLDQNNSLFSNFRGALIENFVAQELKAHFNLPLYYWVSEGNAEIDFIFESVKGTPLPIEVKAGENTKAKSLTLFLSKHPEAQGVRISGLNFRKETRIHNFPLYAVSRLPYF